MAELSYRCLKCKHRINQSGKAPPFFVKCDECGESFVVTPDAPLVGRVIGGHHVLRKINTGGMGMVYLATQLSLRRKVALKVMSDDLTSDERARDQFIHGAISEARISHPNIVQVYDVGFEQNVCYISMEFVSGVSLRQMIAREGQMSVPETLDIARQMLQALGKAHRERVIHRDIKPENILIDREGAVKITDFGLAAILEKSGHARDIDRGTPHYMSPEHARREPLDTRADLYSVGATIYHMLAGRPPYAGPPPLKVLELVKKQPPTPLSAINPSVPDDFSRIVDTMMAREREKRYATAEEALEALDAFDSSFAASINDVEVFGSAKWEQAFESAVDAEWGDDGLPSMDTMTGRRSGNAWKSALALGMVALAAGLVIFALTRGGEVESPRPPDIVDIDGGRGDTDREMPIQPGTSDTGEAQRRFAEIQARAQALAAEGRYVDAAAEFHKFPGELRSAAIDRRLRDLENRYNREARDQAERLANMARTAVSEGRYDDAEELYRRMTLIGLTGPAVEAEDRLEELARLRAVAREEQNLRAEIHYLETIKITGQLTVARNYNEAVGTLEAALDNNDIDAVSERLRHELDMIRSAKEVFDAGLRGLNNNPGARLHVGRHIGEFAGMDDDGILLNISTGRVAVSTADLAMNDVIRFAAGEFDQADPNTFIKYAAFFICENRPANVEIEINRASRRGGNVTDHMIKRAGLLNEAEFKKAENEAWSAMLIFRLRSAIDVDHPVTARDLMETLNAEYSETATYRQNQSYLRDVQNWLDAIRPTKPIYIPPR